MTNREQKEAEIAYGLNRDFGATFQAAALHHGLRIRPSNGSHAVASESDG